MNFLFSRLNELCSNSTDKVMFTIDTMPRVFSLSSKDLVKHHIPFLYCHIDLYLPSKAYGVSVYIEVCIWLSVHNFIIVPSSFSHNKAADDKKQI